MDAKLHELCIRLVSMAQAISDEKPKLAEALKIEASRVAYLAECRESPRLIDPVLLCRREWIRGGEDFGRFFTPPYGTPDYFEAMPSDQRTAWRDENHRLEAIHDRLNQSPVAFTNRAQYRAMVMAEVEGVKYAVDPASIDKANRDAAYPR